MDFHYLDSENGGLGFQKEDLVPKQRVPKRSGLRKKKVAQDEEGWRKDPGSGEDLGDQEDESKLQGMPRGKH